MDDSPELATQVIENILNGGGFLAVSAHPVALLSTALVAEHYGQRRARTTETPNAHTVKLTDELASFVEWYDGAFSGMCRRGLMASLLEELIERARDAMGDRWALYRLAAAHAGSFTLPPGRIDPGEILRRKMVAGMPECCAN